MMADQETIKRVGLFGGTFDPIHEGHVRLALEFAKRLSLDRVLLMPTLVPPHKLKPDIAPADDRLEMCRLAAMASPILEVSDLEIRREGASFTADTLDTLHERYPSAQLYLITGADMFLTLGTWHRFADIAQQAVLCAAPRGADSAASLREYARQLEKLGARCIVEDIPVLDVSSTEIRERLRCGLAVICLPPPVEAYIRRRGLYAAPSRMEALDMDDQFIEIIRGRLTPKRFRHSLAVAEEAVRLANKYGADPAKARTAGILHDIMKDERPDALLQMFRDFAILLDDVEKNAPPLWHARAGAAFIERVLGVSDADILAAVRYHTTARAGMSLLEKIIYLADITSADRDYPDVKEMRRIADTGILPAMEYALSYSIRDLLSRRKALHPDTIGAYNEAVTATPSKPKETGKAEK